MSTEVDRSEAQTHPILKLFDSLCVSFGDEDAVMRLSEDESEGISYTEIQEASLSLAYQLRYRFDPDVVLVDCFGHAAAESVAVLACMRLAIPFVPVEVQRGHTVMDNMVNLLRSQSDHPVGIAAICCVTDDHDPRLGVFYNSNVHQILFVDPVGFLREQIPVPQCLPSTVKMLKGTADRAVIGFEHADALYVLFTSGTTTSQPKAVVGSLTSTARRLEWFRKTFPPSARVARRTPLTFVDGVTELLTALLEHDSILLVQADPDTLLREGVARWFQNEQEDWQPTQITLLPSQMEQVLLLMRHDSQLRRNCARLERLVVSGEICSEQLYRNVRTALPQCQFINLYGQTETTGDCLCAVLSDLDEERAICNGFVTVGRPILPDIQCSIIPLGREAGDHELSSHLFGSPSEKQKFGELLILGNQSLGYLKTPGQMQCQSPSTRWPFATGDAAFFQYVSNSTDPMWYVQGRTNDLQKLNGNWTSPSEIETALRIVYPNSLERVTVIILEDNAYAVVERVQGTNWLFNRDEMHEKGIPWHLIPRHVLFVDQFPIGNTGKVNRKAIQDMVRNYAIGSHSSSNGIVQPKGDGEIAKQMITMVLDLPSLDETKSFTNLGGDSASAVTLLYHLKSILPARSLKNFTAADIVSTKSITELLALIGGELPSSKKRKRIRMVNSNPHSFHPQSICFSSRHRIIRFLACVDASHVLCNDGNNPTFYIGCHGGIIQRICVHTNRVLSFREFPGWSIQANTVIHSGFVYVCLYNRTNDGMVVCSNMDLSSIVWSKMVRMGAVHDTPTIVNEWLQVRLGMELYRLSLITGAEEMKEVLPASIWAKSHCVADATVFQSSDDKGNALWALGHNTTEGMVLKYVPLASTKSMGPVTKEAVDVDHRRFLLADSLGSIHLVHTETWEVSSLVVCDCPLGHPSEMSDGHILVGGYNGVLYCIQLVDDEALQIVWDVFVGAVIYSKPIFLPRTNTCLVCTTAGYIHHLRRDGVIIHTDRISGEIWSIPKVLESNAPDLKKISVIAVGARDSNVHIIAYDE